MSNILQQSPSAMGTFKTAIKNQGALEGRTITDSQLAPLDPAPARQMAAPPAPKLGLDAIGQRQTILASGMTRPAIGAGAAFQGTKLG